MSRLHGDTGDLLRIGNGAVVAHDETGLTLRLSDSTIAEIGARLCPVRIDPAILGDIDAWNVTESAGWLHFDAKLPAYPYPRRFRRAVSGGDILADAPGPLCAMLGLGGARRAMALPGSSAFPAHVVAPADDTGAAGLAGTAPAEATAALQHLGECPIDALAAAAYLRGRAAEGRALPLVLARCETDASRSVAELLDGPAIANLGRGMENLAAAAGTLGTTARILGIALDFAAEDTISDFGDYVAGIRAIIDRLTAHAARLGLQAPPFVMRADSSGRRTEEHWHLSVFPDGRHLIFATPDSIADRTETLRLTPEGLHRLAAMEARAIAATEAREPWAGPRLLLAEFTDTDCRCIRVTAEALEPLVVEDRAGFTCHADGAPVAIASVEVTPDDPAALLVDLAEPVGGAAVLSYGHGVPGGLRDTWQTADPVAGRLHRRALPAILPVHPC